MPTDPAADPGPVSAADPGPTSVVGLGPDESAPGPRPRPPEPVEDVRGSVTGPRAPLALLAALAALPIVVGLASFLRQPWLATSDDALIELSTLSVPARLPLYGVYSRFDFHHPGPAEFYLLAVPLRVFGARGMMIGPAVLNLAAVVATVVVLRRRGGLLLAGLGAAVLVVVELRMGAALFDPWNPWVCVLPFALVVVLGWSVLCRDWWALPAVVVVASAVVQAHLGYLPPAGFVTAVAVVSAGWAWARRRACPGRVLAVAGGLGLLVWLPPLVQQLIGDPADPGNLGRILDAMVHPSEATVGWSAAVSGMAREVGLSPPWLTGVEPSYAGVLTGSSWWSLFAACALALGALALAVRARAGDAVRGQVLLLALVPVGVLTMARVQGANAPYLIRWSWVIGSLLWLTSVWCVVCWWRTTGAADRLRARAGPSGARVAGMAAAFALVVGSVVVGSSLAGEAPLFDVYGRAAAALADPAHDAVAGKGRVLLVARDENLHMASFGLLAELQRRGDDVVIGDPFAFQAGAAYVLGDRPAAWNLVVAGDDQVDLLLGRGSQPIATFDGLTPDERVEVTDLQQRARRGETLDDAQRARQAALAPANRRYALFLQPAAPAGGRPAANPGATSAPAGSGGDDGQR